MVIVLNLFLSVHLTFSANSVEIAYCIDLRLLFSYHCCHNYHLFGDYYHCHIISVILMNTITSLVIIFTTY